MSESFVLTVPDNHYEWLQKVRVRRGWERVQDAVRSLIEDAYRAEQKSMAGADANVLKSDMEAKNVIEKTGLLPAKSTA